VRRAGTFDGAAPEKVKRTIEDSFQIISPRPARSRALGIATARQRKSRWSCSKPVPVVLVSAFSAAIEQVVFDRVAQSVENCSWQFQRDGVLQR
jgi:hypothetical protein